MTMKTWTLDAYDDQKKIIDMPFACRLTLFPDAAISTKRKIYAWLA